MATRATEVTPFSNLSLSNYAQPDPIDLTLDDDNNVHVSTCSPEPPRLGKRPRIVEHSSFDAYETPPGNPFLSYATSTTPVLSPRPNSQGPHPSILQSSPSGQRPNYFMNQVNHPTSAHFQGPSTASRPAFSSSVSSHKQPLANSSPIPTPPNHHMDVDTSERQIIDLTGSPSPPPSFHRTPTPLPSDLSPKTPVCIGELTVTALILYPVQQLRPLERQSHDPDWFPVRLQYEPTPHKPGGADTIHIRSPHCKSPSGEIIPGEAFGVVEQRVATTLGPMLGKGLIRLDGKLRRGLHDRPILPLQMLVYTPKGNIPVVGDYLYQQGLLLEHPITSYDAQRLANHHYHNPHNPPPAGHNRVSERPNYSGSVPSKWAAPAVSAKSIEVQRSQVDELFKSLKSGEELLETEPPYEVVTKLYPHQKKALTFLLEREGEKVGKDGNFSLWQERNSSTSQRSSWFNIITQTEVFEEPQETKGAILADDMGLGKTITCVALIAATLESAISFADCPILPVTPPATQPPLTPAHFAGLVWDMPPIPEPGNGSLSAKGKAKAARLQDKLEADHVRACRIKARSRGTLIICPLSTVANWEDQFREHWRGKVNVCGGSGGCTPSLATMTCHAQAIGSQSSQSSVADSDEGMKTKRSRSGRTLRVYVYHGNARRPDPAFLADFDAVITTYATLATEYSKQARSVASAGADEEEEEASSDQGADFDDRGNLVVKLPQAKNSLKRKKISVGALALEATSPLQSIHWFRVVLDEAHSIKETSTVASRASCDLMADRRLCLTGTPVQNKLDDIFALIKFLRLHPFNDKSVWTEFIGTPVKYGQALGVARLQTIMKCITLRRTKETRAQDGQRILSLPPRRDELRYLKFDEQEQQIYDQFFNESKAEFAEMSDKNEVMKNYVGILQKILRLRQICDHFELVKGKGLRDASTQDSGTSYEDVVAAINAEGFNTARASAIFALLRESATTQCVECGIELSATSDAMQNDTDCGSPAPAKRGRKLKTSASRNSTRANSPSTPRPVLTRCQHLFCLECYRSCICPSWPQVPSDVRRSCTACQTGLGVEDAVEVRTDCPLEPMTKKKCAKNRKRQKGTVSLETFHPSTKVKALLNDLSTLSRTNPYSSNYEPDALEVQMVDDQGNGLDESITKTVVFSQWTSMLDKVEDALDAAGIRYERLDGTMRRDERSRAMEALKYDPGCEVLLVSLKAGGVGLNLTAAQRVYLMDPYWNPAVENQAVDRIHRLGQTRPVTTVRFIIENSIEARLLEVQKKKTALANMTLGQHFSKAEMLQRRMEELNELFGS